MQDAPAKPAPAQPAAASTYDPELAKSLGADERGMRMYVFVLLKTGPKTMPAGPERDAMFKGHMANIQRLANEGKLMLAGPYGKTDGGATDWRGLFIFAVPTIEEARALVATDPVVMNEEMVPEFHQWYGSAAIMAIPDVHKKITPPEKK